MSKAAPVPTADEWLASSPTDQRKVGMVKLLNHYTYHKEIIRRLVGATGLDPDETSPQEAIAVIESLREFYCNSSS